MPSASRSSCFSWSPSPTTISRVCSPKSGVSIFLLHGRPFPVQWPDAAIRTLHQNKTRSSKRRSFKERTTPHPCRLYTQRDGGRVFISSAGAPRIEEHREHHPRRNECDRRAGNFLDDASGSGSVEKNRALGRYGCLVQDRTFRRRRTRACRDARRTAHDASSGAHRVVSRPPALRVSIPNEIQE